jgi:iron complex transport system substrate-binding protein
MRVVSVLPSATELVCALGHRADLVGRSAECDYPTDVRELPVVMRPRRWDGDAPSGQIDARVRDVRGRGESLYELDVERLAQLQPEVLFTQDLCGVCSVTPDEVEAACARAGVRPRVVALTPRRLEEVWNSAEAVGSALTDPGAGRSLAEELRARSRRSLSASGPRVAVVEWLDPPILAGLWSPEMVTAAGGVPVGPEPGEPGVRTSWEALAGQAPDLVVISPCSFSVDRTRRELADPATRARVASLGAPPLGVHLADEAYFSRPGPRLADGVDLLRHLLRSEAWDPPMPVQPWSSPEVGA